MALHSSKSLPIDHSLADNSPKNIRNNPQFTSGIFGVLQLKITAHIIIIKDVVEVGNLFNQHVIYKIKHFEILPLLSSTITKNLISNDKDENYYLYLLKKQLKSESFYFSTTLDLTNSFQKSKASNIINSPDFKPNYPFYWNSFALKPLIELAAKNPIFKNFLSYVVNGFIDLGSFHHHKDTKFRMALITRKSKFRAGTRYFRRGIDKDGNVANFNETEQLLLVSNNDLKNGKSTLIMSYIQIRGSIPVYWAEINNLKYKPPLAIGEFSSTSSAELHFQNIFTNYHNEKLVLINLINSTGHEKKIKDKINYIYFDFHENCKNLKFENVNILIEQLINSGDLNNDEFSVSKIDTTDHITTLQSQKNILRSNCMDCLDRTNVVQSSIAEYVLQKQFEHLNIIEKNGINFTQKFPKFFLDFKKIWTHNANSISKSYSGTNALKTDFTRMGKRTLSGLFKDAYKSLNRYFLNNFYDGSRQDSFDLILGEITHDEFFLKENEGLTTRDNRPMIVQLVPNILKSATVLLLTVIFYPKNNSLSSPTNLISLGCCCLSIFFSAYFIMHNGMQYVNWPKLKQLDYLQTQEIFSSQNHPSIKYVIHDNYLLSCSFNKIQ
ncbi:uncharacterized protein ASCRUDRAFT_36902 [Ascoidea rubescens DSM 1968]|uniref:SAC domain-containing protein n=1 Tax=Ascoidea rubescens DSM 1968 TaxID=1344418 RepID=A0A1D2VDP6_9ASCO|nr:hypothetical protein ASCRUDRAFT_36902 [Ascoidea rubescens DSM 1968]ODV59755.1 hypothetical protein ASCRUDRAFT_36902 [Ascoidea rubescens DSM 1968]